MIFGLCGRNVVSELTRCRLREMSVRPVRLGPIVRIITRENKEKRAEVCNYFDKTLPNITPFAIFTFTIFTSGKHTRINDSLCSDNLSKVDIQIRSVRYEAGVQILSVQFNGL